MSNSCSFSSCRMRPPQTSSPRLSTFISTNPKSFSEISELCCNHSLLLLLPIFSFINNQHFEFSFIIYYITIMRKDSLTSKCYCEEGSTSIIVLRPLVSLCYVTTSQLVLFCSYYYYYYYYKLINDDGFGLTDATIMNAGWRRSFRTIRKWGSI